MRLLGLTPQQALMFGAVIAGMLALLYLLKMRRRRVTVPFSPLWAKMLMQKQAADWIQRLKRLFSLALQLLIVAFLLLALMDPQPEVEVIRGKSFAVVLDTSASMSALEPSQNKTRWELAKEKTIEIIDDLSPQDKMILIAVDGQVRSVTGDFTSDKVALRAGLDALRPTATEARILDALSTAADALGGRPEPSLILISDAAHPTLPALPPTLIPPLVTFRHESVAAPPTDQPTEGPIVGNVSLNGFNIRRYLSNKLEYELFIQIQNHFAQPVCIQLGLFNVIPSPDNAPDVEKFIPLKLSQESTNCEATTPGYLPFEIQPKDHNVRFYKNLSPSHDRIRARVALARRKNPPPDAPALIDTLDMDDSAYVIVPQAKQLNVLAVTGENLFLRAVLLHNDNIKPTFLAPADATPERILASQADIVIFDNSTPPPDQPIAPTPPGPGNYLYINPQGEAAPFKITPIKRAVLLNTVNRRHPMARWLALRDINTSQGSVLKPKDPPKTSARNETLASAPEGPVIVTSRRSADNINLVGIGFSLAESDIVMRFALPILFINAFDWFMDEQGSLVEGYRTGLSWHIKTPIDLSRADIQRPDGALERDIPIHERDLVYYGALPGFYSISPAAAPGQPPKPPVTTIAANFASWSESLLTSASPYPPSQAVIPPDPEQPQTNIFDGWAWVFDRLSRFDLWVYCVLISLSLLIIEWFTYHRRHTV